MLPLSVRINYCIQLACALTTAFLNPFTLYFRVKRNNRNDQFSMLFFHMVIHFLFAITTVMFTVAATLSNVPVFASVTARSITAWAGILHISMHPTIGLVDLFVSLDRLMAVTFPFKYVTVIRTKLLSTAVLLCSTFCISTIILYSHYRKPKLRGAIETINYVNPTLMQAAYVWNLAMIIANIIMSSTFVVKLRKYLTASQLQPHNGPAKLANTIVINQIILESIFWMAPALIKVVMEDGLHSKTVIIRFGPVTLTTFMVYVMSCSIMYWRKLRGAKTDDECFYSSSSKTSKR